MDPAGVLLALEERKKWTARMRRIEERIKQLERRRSSLTRELAEVRKKVAEYAALVRPTGNDARGRDWPIPPILIR